MGRRGFPAASRTEKLAKGERRPSRVNYAEPELPPPATLDPPAGLDGEGRAEWARQIAHLTDRGVLTAPDLTAFEDYCRALEELRRFEAKAKRAGPELAIAKGYQGMVIKLRAQVSHLRQQCGLTPASRSGVKATPSRTETNPAERYLRALPFTKPAS
jgi:P27 family predicted phage terminase small subunit